MDKKKKLVNQNVVQSMQSNRKKQIEKLSGIFSVRMHDLRLALYDIGNYIACATIIGDLARIHINGARFQKRQNKINKN